MLLMTRAGTPATTVFAGTDLVTTAPAATMLLSPMVTPPNTVACAPIQTFFPTVMGRAIMLALSEGETIWLSVANTT